MSSRIAATILSCALCAGVSLHAAVAQQLDDPSDTASIQEKFLQQKSLPAPDLGQPRGLLIAPSATVEEGGADVTPDTGYTSVPSEMQVNIAITFEFDSASLRPEERPKLIQLCDAMKTMEDTAFRIIGHTDAVGPPDYNLHLSSLRAEEVRRVMIQDCGISADRLNAFGVGESHLLDAADPAADRNRRVEFQVGS